MDTAVTLVVSRFKPTPPLTIVSPADESSQDYCERLANQLNKLDDLPKGCLQYGLIVDKVKRKEAASDPFAGMWAGAASKARAARSKGQESHHQIQRRMTSQGRRFSKLDK